MSAVNPRNLKDQMIRWNLAITSLLVIGLVIRVRYLWTHHLWNDEISTMRVAKMPWSDMFDFLRTIEPHPPASFLFIKGTNLLFFNQLTVDQLKYVVLTWTVMIGLVAFWAVKRMSWIALPVLAGFALVATNPLFAYLGAEVRPYSLLIALVFALLWYSVLWISTTHSGVTPGRRGQAAMVALLVLPVWTQYAGVVLVISVVIAIEVIGVVRRRTLDLVLMRVSLVALLLVAPLGIFLTRQLSITVSTARTPVPELMGYLGWSFGGLGALLGIAVIVVWLGEFRGAVRPIEVATDGSDHRSELVTIGWFALLVVGLFFVGVTIAKVLTGIQLVNMGVAIVPALFAVVGFASLLAAVREAAVTWIVVLSVVVMTPIAIIVTDTPSVLRPNRISNVDVLFEVSGAVGIDAGAGDGTLLISLDGPRSNAYFAAHAQARFPAARIEPVFVLDFDTVLNKTLESGIQDPTIDRIVLVTRYGFDYRVRPYIPDGLRVVQVSDYAWLMEKIEPAEIE